MSEAADPSFPLYSRSEHFGNYYYYYIIIIIIIIIISLLLLLTFIQVPFINTMVFLPRNLKNT